jgi:hypothetical protein
LFNNALPTTAAPTPMATPSHRYCRGLPAQAEGKIKISVKTDAITIMIKFFFFIFQISFFKAFAPLDVACLKRFKYFFSIEREGDPGMLSKRGIF